MTSAALRAIVVVLTFVEPCFWKAMGVGAIGHTSAKKMANAATIITALVAVLSIRAILERFGNARLAFLATDDYVRGV